MNIKTVGSSVVPLAIQKQGARVGSVGARPRDAIPGVYFEKSVQGASYLYSKDSRVHGIQSESERKIGDFSQIISKFFNVQSDLGRIAYSGEKLADIVTKRVHKATPDEISAAQAQLGPGGFYSPDAVAERIMQMAMNLSGGDSTKVGALKESFVKGFDQATAAWGSKLPDVCHETYEKVMAAFDKWESSN